MGNARRDGVPEFEPNLKAGGHWHSRLTVPDDIRESGDRPSSPQDGGGGDKAVTWIIEIASQILFSNTASVNYELLVGRDQRDLDVGFAAIASRGHGEPGKVTDLVQFQTEGTGQHLASKGVYAGAIRLQVEDTAALWSKPSLPKWDNKSHRPRATDAEAFKEILDPSDHRDRESLKARKPKKVHLVIVTHGLHSNVGADMLYMKESIDATVKEAREDSRRRRASFHRHEASLKPEHSSDPNDPNSDDKFLPGSPPAQGNAPSSGNYVDEDSDDEEVLVRGFPGNAVRTERGIQYLGKRLAKFILTYTYPDQPFLPPGKSMRRSFTGNFPFSNSKRTQECPASHPKSSVHKVPKSGERLPYTFSSISFVGHSLGGLVQTYAIAYIHKHSPGFFNHIKPVNFVTMAAPFLGLSNENPMYVRFALDFGLVGRTGQDLGLTWRPPTIARSGWSAVIAGLGGAGNDERPEQEDPRSKPLLRILPSGPAHQVLKMFRNRTVYSNVVNDGIVPLRTSCLLFLDWRGLDRVENARRGNGLISTMAQFGWNELTGANTTSHRPKSTKSANSTSSEDDLDINGSKDASLSASPHVDRSYLPKEATRTQSRDSPKTQDFLASRAGSAQVDALYSPGHRGRNSSFQYSPPSNALSDFLNLFRPASPRSPPPKPHKVSGKMERAYQRAQVVKKEGNPSSAFSVPSDTSSPEPDGRARPSATRGDSLQLDSSSTMPPPKTSIFEAAGDIINPPIPTQQWLIDPSSRTRTVFHDRVYHPEDIPPPPRKRSLLSRTISNETLKGNKSPQQQDPSENGGMKVDEKIARAYHHDLSWRKVLVRLEPDAHNNMIVRRMFANAYGWEVIKHLCDTHFGNSYEATTEDADEMSQERAKAPSEPVTEEGKEVHEHGHNKPSKGPRQSRTASELKEAADELMDLDAQASGAASLVSRKGSTRHGEEKHLMGRQDSVLWTDDVFNEDSEDEETDEDEGKSPLEKFHRFWAPGKGRRDQQLQRRPRRGSADAGRELDGERKGTSESEIAAFLTKSPATMDSSARSEPWPLDVEGAKDRERLEKAGVSGR